MYARRAVSDHVENVFSPRGKAQDREKSGAAAHLLRLLSPSDPSTMAVAQLAMKQEAETPPPPSFPPSSAPDTADPLGLEERILTLCSQHAKGITDDVIVKDQPSIDAEKRRTALQRLLSQVWAGLLIINS